MQISIFGYGVTTTPLVAFLNHHHHKLHIYDDKFSTASCDENGNVLCNPSAFRADKSDLEIISPGIAPTHQLVKKARHLTSEYDYFASLMPNSNAPQIIWISGTNGKTTTTEMTTALLAMQGAQSGGNIGTPLAILYQQNAPIWVLETSSFSLHYTKHAKPYIYALLPVKEDHISWHGDFESYTESKLSPLTRMDKQSYAFIPRELASHDIVKNYQGELILYADSADLAAYCGVKAQNIPFKEPFLLDALLALNIAQKIALSSLSEQLQILSHFQIGAHRIEEFYDNNGQLWVDDSKGTNVDASIEAVRRYESAPLKLILGGDDKGANLTPLFAFLQRLQHIEIYAIGSNEARLAKLAKDYGILCFSCGDLANAIKAIKERLKPQEVVLLSPAAASLDQFSSYKERGLCFQKLALE